MAESSQDWTTTARDRTVAAIREGQTGVPYYCGHTELWFNTAPKEWGLPVMRRQFGEFDRQGRVKGTPCMTWIYKQLQE